MTQLDPLTSQSLLCCLSLLLPSCKFSFSCFPFLSSAHTLNISQSPPGIVWPRGGTFNTENALMWSLSSGWPLLPPPSPPWTMPWGADSAQRDWTVSQDTHWQGETPAHSEPGHLAPGRSPFSLALPAAPASGLLHLLFRPWQPDFLSTGVPGLSLSLCVTLAEPNL